MFRSHIAGFANDPQISPTMTPIVAQSVERHTIIGIGVNGQVVVTTCAQNATAPPPKRPFCHLNHFCDRVFFLEPSFRIIALVERQTTLNERLELGFCRFVLFILDIDVNVAQSNAPIKSWEEPVGCDDLVVCMWITYFFLIVTP